MVDTLQQKTIVDPSLGDVLQIVKQDIFATLNCHLPGQIQSFDPDACTATVQPLIKRVLPDGTIQSRPLLLDCPVFFPSGGGGRLTFPVAVGDQCLIFFNDRRLDEWFQNGAEAAPASVRMHDMSDAIVAVGLDPTGAFGSVPTDKVVLSYMDTRFELTADGWNFVAADGAEIDLSDTVDLTASAGGEITLDAKVSIKNNATTLLAVINGLITVIEGLQVTGPLALTPASVAALEAYKLTVATLLE